MGCDYFHVHIELESFRKGTSEFFKREAGFQKAYQGASLRPGQVATARRGVGSGHSEANHHTQQEVRMTGQ